MKRRAVDDLNISFNLPKKRTEITMPNDQIDANSKPRVTIVVAMAENSCIGRDGDLPWHISTDLKRFKSVTMGHPLVMGRKTYDSIGRPLPGRPNIVLTRDTEFSADGIDVVHSMDAAMEKAAAHGSGAIMVIGGAEIFALALPMTDCLDICEVHADVPGDTFFPDLDTNDWTEKSRETHAPEKPEGPAFSFVVYNRTA